MVSFKYLKAGHENEKKQYKTPFQTVSGMFPQTVKFYKLSFDSCYCLKPKEVFSLKFSLDIFNPRQYISKKVRKSPKIGPGQKNFGIFFYVIFNYYYQSFISE